MTGEIVRRVHSVAKPDRIILFGLVVSTQRRLDEMGLTVRLFAFALVVALAIGALTAAATVV